jgi:hypothetical protein
VEIDDRIGAVEVIDTDIEETGIGETGIDVERTDDDLVIADDLEKIADVVEETDDKPDAVDRVDDLDLAKDGVVAAQVHRMAEMMDVN